MDEEQAVNTPVAPVSDGTDSAPVEQTTDPAPQPQEPTEQETPEVEAPKEGRNAQGRIQQLVAEKKRFQQERDQYAAQLQQQTQSEVPDEIDPNEYRAMQYNNTVVAQELQTMKLERLAEKLESSAGKAYAEFPELKENKVLDEKLSQQWERDYAQKNAKGEIVGYSISPDQYVREQMEIMKEFTSNVTAQTAQTLQRQSSESAITPQTNQQTSTKEFKDLSLAEMEKQLGVVRE